MLLAGFVFDESNEKYGREILGADPASLHYRIKSYEINRGSDHLSRDSDFAPS